MSLFRKPLIVCSVLLLVLSVSRTSAMAVGIDERPLLISALQVNTSTPSPTPRSPTPTRTPTPINIGNFVWNDFDGDGTQDAGEPGLAGVTVQLWNGDKTDMITSTTTNASGFYTVVAPMPGAYRVRVLLPGAGDQFSPKDNAVSDLVDSDINPSGPDAGYTDVINISSAVIVNNTIDAGVMLFRSPTPTRTPTPINIGNFVWHDLDGDGVQDTGEPGVAGVTVELWNADKTDMITTTTTNANGLYTLVAPLAGDYRVRVIPPSGSSFTLKDVGVDTTDSDINPSGADVGFTDVFNIASNVILLNTKDAGLTNVQPTATSTGTPTRTPSLTSTPSDTPTSSSTPTRTETGTPTPSKTSGPPATETPTPTSTLTTDPAQTSTPSSTATPTRTSTLTLTPSLTLVQVGTSTVGPTVTRARRDGRIEKSVSPLTGIRAGDTITFTVTITLGSAHDGVSVQDTFSGGGRAPDTDFVQGSATLDGSGLSDPQLVRNVPNWVQYRFDLGRLEAGVHTLTYQWKTHPDLGCYTTVTNGSNLDTTDVAGHLSSTSIGVSIRGPLGRCA